MGGFLFLGGVLKKGGEVVTGSPPVKRSKTEANEDGYFFFFLEATNSNGFPQLKIPNCVTQTKSF